MGIISCVHWYEANCEQHSGKPAKHEKAQWIACWRFYIVRQCGGVLSSVVCCDESQTDWIKEHAICTTPIPGAWIMCSLNILIELPKQTRVLLLVIHSAVQYSLVLIIGIAYHTIMIWWICLWTQCKNRKPQWKSTFRVYTSGYCKV